MDTDEDDEDEDEDVTVDTNYPPASSYPFLASHEYIYIYIECVQTLSVQFSSSSITAKQVRMANGALAWGLKGNRKTQNGAL